MRAEKAPPRNDGCPWATAVAQARNEKLGCTTSLRTRRRSKRSLALFLSRARASVVLGCGEASRFCACSHGGCSSGWLGHRGPSALSRQLQSKWCAADQNFAEKQGGHAQLDQLLPGGGGYGEAYGALVLISAFSKRLWCTSSFCIACSSVS